MEFAQAGHHFMVGTYLAYLAYLKIGGVVFNLWPFDPAARKAYANWWKMVLRRPAALFDRVYVQSIGIIQAPDILPDGRADMCDNCPDHHSGRQAGQFLPHG